MKTLEEINKIISWWINLKQGFTDIDLIIYSQQKLSGHAYYLAEESATVKENYNAGYFMRKINVAKSKNSFINQGKSAAAAETAAIEKNEDFYETEMRNESHAYKLDLLLKQVNHILSAMQQRISYLKQEKQNTKNISSH